MASGQWLGFYQRWKVGRGQNFLFTACTQTPQNSNHGQVCCSRVASIYLVICLSASQIRTNIKALEYIHYQKKEWWNDENSMLMTSGFGEVIARENWVAGPANNLSISTRSRRNFMAVIVFYYQDHLAWIPLITNTWMCCVFSPASAQRERDTILTGKLCRDSLRCFFNHAGMQCGHGDFSKPLYMCPINTRHTHTHTHTHTQKNAGHGPHIIGTYGARCSSFSSSSGVPAPSHRRRVLTMLWFRYYRRSKEVFCLILRLCSSFLPVYLQMVCVCVCVCVIRVYLCIFYICVRMYVCMHAYMYVNL